MLGVVQSLDRWPYSPPANDVSACHRKEVGPGLRTVVALLALGTVTAHVAEAAARVALLRASAVAIASAATVAATVAATHAAHAARALRAVASDVAETTTLVALLAGGSLLSWAVLGQVAWLVAAVADTIGVATSGWVSRLRAVAREMARLLAVVADWVVTSRAVARLVTSLSA